MVVDQQISAQALLQAVREEVPGGLLQHLTLFDEYRGKGLLENEKSLAFRVVLQDTQSTLQDDKVDLLVTGIINALTQKFGARLRA